MSFELMKAWLERLNSSAHRDNFVLRGGLLMNEWVPGRRQVQDLDFLALMTLEQTDMAVHELSSDFGILAAETIWAETPAPGRRYTLGPQPWQIDIGTDDPMVVPPQRKTALGVEVLCCAPEVMYGWKMHGLFERGEGKWRARDLWDLYLMQHEMELADDILPQAVEIAFSSRNMPLAETARFLQDEWGRSKGSKRKWTKFCNDSGAQARIVDDLETVKSSVANRLKEILDRINQNKT